MGALDAVFGKQQTQVVAAAKGRSLPTPTAVYGMFLELPKTVQLNDGAKVITAQDLIDRKRIKFSDRAFQLLATTGPNGMWAAKEGQGVAAFGIERYAVANVKTRIDKLLHGAEVAWHTNRIADEQAKRGGALEPKWRKLLEYAAFLHDVGYVYGYDEHQKTGAADILALLGNRLAARGVTLSRPDIERVAALVNLHPTNFPWKLFDKRIAGEQYIDVKVVQQIMADPEKTAAVARLVRTLNADYVEKNKNGKPPPFAFLDDPKEMKQLYSAGYMLHCGDCYCGGCKPPAKPLEQPDLVRTGLGQGVPIDSLEALAKYKPSGNRYYQREDVYE